MIDMDNYPHRQPATEFSWWDVAGVASYTFGTVLNVVDDGFRMLSRVFFAAGENSRAVRDQRRWEEGQEQARREMAQQVEGIIYGPGDLLS